LLANHIHFQQVSGARHCR